MSDGQLGATLSTLKVPVNDVKEIVKLKEGGHFQVACQRHFEVTHADREIMDKLQLVSKADKDVNRRTINVLNFFASVG
jgi:Eukaryotic and archaeal DNA primase, large subunit